MPRVEDRVIDAVLPDSRAIWIWQEHMNSLGPRLTGNEAHCRFIDFLEANFARAGLAVERDRYKFSRWDAGRVALSLTGADGPPVEVPVASYYPASGSTSDRGGKFVAGPLEYLGPVAEAHCDPEQVRGRIVLVDCAFEEVPHRYTRLWGVHDPAGKHVPPRTWFTAAKQWGAIAELRQAAIAAGARGLLLAWTNITDETARGQYQPILPESVQAMDREERGAASGPNSAPAAKSNGLPALWVGQRARQLLLSASSSNATVSLTLEAQVFADSPTDTIVATLPGMTDEAIMLISHSDGGSASQENGCCGLLALAHAFAKLPKESRRRTLIFVAATAHYANGLRDAATGLPASAETEGVLERRPELIKHLVAGLSIEHLGLTEWVDDGQKYFASGLPAWAQCLTPNRPMAEIMLECMRHTGNTRVLATDGAVWGMARPLALAGIPTMSYGSVAPYSMSSTTEGHLDKISMLRMTEEIRGFAFAIARLDGMAAAHLMGDAAFENPVDAATKRAVS